MRVTELKKILEVQQNLKVFLLFTIIYDTFKQESWEIRPNLSSYDLQEDCELEQSFKNFLKIYDLFIIIVFIGSSDHNL